jgi:RNA polymerase sigma-70 factor (ECF subfamily)
MRMPRERETRLANHLRDLALAGAVLPNNSEKFFKNCRRDPLLRRGPGRVGGSESWRLSRESRRFFRIFGKTRRLVSKVYEHDADQQGGRIDNSKSARPISTALMTGSADETSMRDEDFVRLMTAGQRDLRAFILGLAPQQVDADDILQEVNLALWRKRHLYNHDENYLRWAFGFAALEVRSFRSRSAKGRLWFSDTAIESLAEGWPQASSFRDDCRQALAACLKKLGRVEREVIDAKYNKRLSVKDIAASTGRPESTVYKILNRGRESLRACVKRFQLESNR